MTGADRRAYLQGLLTNDIEALTPGTGCYAALLTAQGRMITDMRVVELGEAILIDLPGSLTESRPARISSASSSAKTCRCGTSAPSGRKSACTGRPRRRSSRCSEEVQQTSRRFHFSAASAVPVAGRRRDRGPQRRGWSGRLRRRARRRRGRRLHGCVPGELARSTSTSRRRRSSAWKPGRPRFGIDMDTETIPLEAGIEDRAISRTKGCYVGQEVIVRVIDRGHGRVARRLVGLQLSSARSRAGPGSSPANGRSAG